MNNKENKIIAFGLGFGLTCFVWAILFTILAKNLQNRVNILENDKGVLKQEIIDLKWHLEQVEVKVCEVKW